MKVNKTKHEALVLKNEELMHEIKLLKDKIRIMEEAGVKAPFNKQSGKLPSQTEESITGQFHQMFETNQAIKLIIDPENGKIIKANKSALAFYGHPEEVLTSMHIHEINVLSENEVKAEMELARTEHRLYFNFKHKLASGQIRDVEVFSGPFNSGNKTLLLSIIHDISQRKKALEELHENESLLRSIAENFPNSYLSIIEKDMTCGYTAGQELKKQNLDPAAFIGLSLKEVFGEHEPMVRHYYEKTFKGEEQSFELFINKQHQLYRTIPFANEKGEVNQILSVIENITKRKETESALKKSEERLDLIIKGSQDAPWDWDLANHRIYYAPQWWEQLGYLPNELPSDEQLWHQWLHPEDVSKVDELFGKGLKSDMASYETEFRLKHKKGHYVPLLSRGIVTRDNAGNAIRLSGSNMDLSELKKSERVLKESQARYKNFIANTSEGIYRVEMKEPVSVDLPEKKVIDAINKQSVIAEVNPALAAMYGLKVEDMVGKPVIKFAPDYGERALLILKSQKFRVTNRQTKDFDKAGNAIHLTETYHGEIEDGKLIRIWGVQRNITEALKVKKELLEMQERYELAMEATRDGLFDWNLVSNEIYYSPGWKSMLGYKYDELPNDFSVWESLTEPEDVKKSWEMQQKVINKELDRFEMEFKMKHKDGHLVDILSRASAIFNNQGEAVRFVGYHVDISDRKKTDKILKEKEERFRKMIEYMPNGIAIYNPVDGEDDFRFVEVNKHTEIITNASRKELIGNTLLEKFPNMINAPLLEALKKVNRTGKDVYLPPFFYKDDKRQGWRENYIYKLQSGEIVAVFTDVTDMQTATKKLESQNIELKAAKERTEESEARFKALHDASFGGIAIHDKGIILDCNLGLSTISGYSHEELIGINVINLLCPEYRDLIMSNILSGYEKPYEVEGIRKNGERYHVRLEARMIPYKGKTARVVEFRDITEHIKAQEALINSEEKYRNIFESIQDTFYEVTLEGEILEISPSIKELSKNQYSPEDLIGENLTMIYANPNDRDAFIEKLKKHGWLSDYEVMLKNKDGSTAFCSVASKIVFDQNGNPVKIIGSLRDITDRKNAESELIVAKEKAEESDRLKSAFLANMSHEIRTPMNGILGFTSLLKEPELSGEDQKKYISVIEKSGDRMLDTINNIIDISKIESGQVSVSVSDINVNEQLEELLEFFMPEAENNNIQLSIMGKLPDQQSIIKSDKEKLNSILTNLIKNAIKFTATGSVKFGCSITEKDSLQFFVRDTGIGIPKTRQEAIFERFVQADIEDKNAYQGSGLGLAISKAYIEMLGGEIWVDSKEGHGSQFSFTIANNADDIKTPPKIIADTKQLNFQQSAKKRFKVLIVDDEEYVATYLSIIIERYTKEILIAKTGIEAVEMCRDNPDIDIVLMDIKTPEINGYEATRRIREFNKEVFIVAQTAFAQTGDREKCIEAGCDDYIAKPIKKRKLLEIIGGHFKTDMA